MGCISYPRLHIYWRQEMQFHVISKHITRKRFKTLLTAFHVVSRDKASKGETYLLWKVQPIITRVKMTCDKLERVPGFYSVDLQMIPFSGTCTKGLRRVVKINHVHKGLEMFVATSDGLI